MRRYDDYRISTDNVFRDLELLDAEVLNVKAGLAIELGQLIRRRGLTQTQTAAALGIDQPRVSALLRGHLKRSSAEKLFAYLGAMGLQCHDSDPGTEEKDARDRPSDRPYRINVNYFTPAGTETLTCGLFRRSAEMMLLAVDRQI